MRVKLTPTFIEKAPLPSSGDRVIYWDDSQRGFGLAVTKAGHRSFLVQYRVANRSRRMHLGAATRDGLSAARDRARKLLGDVAGGRALRRPFDPLVERRKEEALRRGANSLRAVCDAYFEFRGDDLRSAEQQKAHLERLVYPTLGRRLIGEIRRKDIVTLLDGIAEENGPVMSDLVLAFVRKIMRWHQTRDENFISPIVPGLARKKRTPRNRVLLDEELRAIWAAADADSGPFGKFIQFTLLTATRRNESARMKRSELSSANAERPNSWKIPDSRYKTKTDHVVPLSAAALQILAGMPHMGDGEWVFTADGRKPITNFGGLKETFDTACGVKNWRIHDLRRTARSLMSRAKSNPDHAERCLGHAMGAIRETYDCYKYLDEKRQVFEELAALVQRILNPQDKVVPLRGAVG
jgi:integrase